jgi:hypothetical protein
VDKCVQLTFVCIWAPDERPADLVWHSQMCQWVSQTGHLPPAKLSPRSGEAGGPLSCYDCRLVQLTFVWVNIIECTHLPVSGILPYTNAVLLMGYLRHSRNVCSEVC